LRCRNCVDFISINGTNLSDPNNPPGNLFNSTTPSGGSLGIDIDTFDISSLVSAGDNSVRIEAGSGVVHREERHGAADPCEPTPRHFPLNGAGRVAYRQRREQP
ncbi:MAG: hypothetical protein ABGY41_12070, partial [Candidatus Poribacteria bacterium]